jgi:hypothetical protein
MDFRSNAEYDQATRIADEVCHTVALWELHLAFMMG